MSMDAVPTQTSMAGAGFYNRHSAAQAAGIDQMLMLLEQAAGEVAVGEEVLVLADYGSSQGALGIGCRCSSAATTTSTTSS